MAAVQSWIQVRTGWSLRIIKLNLVNVMIVASIMIAGIVIKPVLLLALAAIAFWVGVCYLLSYVSAWFRLPLESKERTWENWRQAAIKERGDSFLTGWTFVFTLGYLAFCFMAAVVFVADELASYL